MLSLELILFGAFVVGALAQIMAMLRRPSADRNVEAFRLSFFFSACLLLVCLVPLWLGDMLTLPVVALNLAGVFLNAVGWLLSLTGQGRASAPPSDRAAGGRGVRTYRVYLQGEPFGLVTRGVFEQFSQGGLLKKQRTVELVDDYQEQARLRGLRVVLLRSRDGSQTLISLEPLQGPQEPIPT